MSGNRIDFSEEKDRRSADCCRKAESFALRAELEKLNKVLTDLDAEEPTDVCSAAYDC